MFTSPYERSSSQCQSCLSQNGSTAGFAAPQRPQLRSRDYFPMSGYQTVGHSIQNNNNDMSQHVQQQCYHTNQGNGYDCSGPPAQYHGAELGDCLHSVSDPGFRKQQCQPAELFIRGRPGMAAACIVTTAIQSDAVPAAAECGRPVLDAHP